MKRRQFLLSTVKSSSSVVAVALIGTVQPCPYCNSLFHSASHHQPDHKGETNEPN